SHPYEDTVAWKEILSKATGFLETYRLEFFNLDRIAGPDDSIVGRVLQCKKCRNIRRPGETQQTGGRTMILHQGKPLKIIVRFGNMVEKMYRLALENAKYPLFLQRPCADVHSKGHQVPG